MALRVTLDFSKFTKGMGEYAKALDRLAEMDMEKAAEEAVKAGAKIVADEIRGRIEALPTEPYRHLKAGERFAGISQEQKKDLEDSFGVTPIKKDRYGGINAKAGFDGYGSYPSKKYPQGLPNQLLARAIESGSSVREKHPFVRTAVQAARKEAEEAMGKVIDKAIQDKMEG